MIDDLAGWCRAERARKGWSQTTLAEFAGISRATVVAVEKDGAAPSRETLAALLRVLPATAEQVATWSGWTAGESAR